MALRKKTGDSDKGLSKPQDKRENTTRCGDQDQEQDRRDCRRNLRYCRFDRVF